MADDSPPVTPPTARAALAEQQARLVRALTGRGRPPEGFDADGVSRAALALLHKRRRSVAKTWPGLAGALGEQFEPLFAAYARETPLPPGGPFDDGYAFAVSLAHAGRLPESARPGLLIARCRGGWPARVAVLKNPLRLFVVVRSPWVGLRWGALPLGLRRRRTFPVEPR